MASNAGRYPSIAVCIGDAPAAHRGMALSAFHGHAANAARDLTSRRVSMKRRACFPVLMSSAVLAAAFLAPPAFAGHGGGIKWADAPPVLPKGAKLAVLQGDPAKPGPFV